MNDETQDREVMMTDGPEDLYDEALYDEDCKDSDYRPWRHALRQVGTTYLWSVIYVMYFFAVYWLLLHVFHADRQLSIIGSIIFVVAALFTSVTRFYG